MHDFCVGRYSCHIWCAGSQLSEYKYIEESVRKENNIIRVTNEFFATRAWNSGTLSRGLGTPAKSLPFASQIYLESSRIT